MELLNLSGFIININAVIAIIQLKASPLQITKCKMVELKLSVLNGLITLFPFKF